LAEVYQDLAHDEADQLAIIGFDAVTVELLLSG
jgi:hypothetical protein